jgi:hypothetical protein
MAQHFACVIQALHRTGAQNWSHLHLEEFLHLTLHSTPLIAVMFGSASSARAVLSLGKAGKAPGAKWLYLRTTAETQISLFQAGLWDMGN